jgi:hypothetical protein
MHPEDLMRPNNEVRFAAAVLAALAIITGFIFTFPPEPFEAVLALTPDEYVVYVAAGMFLHGLMLVGGLVMPCRPLRQWGLAIGAYCWFALFGLFLSAWLVKVTSFLALIIGLAHFITLVIDVKRKPRCSTPS